MHSETRRIPRFASPLVFCMPWVLAAACSSTPSTDNQAAAQESPSDDVAATEQTIEIEPGHTLSIRRLPDSSIMLIEVGKAGEHQQALGDLPAKLPLSAVVQELAPGVELKPALRAPVGVTAAGGQTPAAPATSEESVGQAVQGLVAAGTPKSEDKPIVKVNTASASQDYLTLRCNDPATTMCFPAMTQRAPLDWELGGYYRSLAVNRAAQKAATFKIYQKVGSTTTTLSTISVPAGYFAQAQVMSATLGYFRGEVAVTTQETVGISSLVTEVTPRAQENDHWCWLASGQMALAALGAGREQCTMANQHWGRTDCCQTINNQLYGTTVCDGGGETIQVFQKQGFASTAYDVVASPARLAQLLQSGPVVVWWPSGPHYSVLSDYAEVYENGTWVPKAFHSNPWGPRDYHQESHGSWVRLDQVGTGNGGFANVAWADTHPATHGASLTALISRASWEGDTATVYFDDPTATSFDYQIYNGGTASGYGELWAQGTVAATRTWNNNTWNASMGIGAWLWYTARVRACANGTCGAWMDKHAVSYPPIAALDSLTWANNAITAAVHAEAAPDDTLFRYRVLDAGNAATPPWKAGHIHAGTVSRFSKATSIVFGNQNVGIGPHLWLKFQVQACSQVGCSAWAERTIYTG
jgi:hypothetical protein